MAAMGRKKGPPAIGLASLPHMLCFAVLSDGVHVHSLPSDRSASPRLQVCDTYRFFLPFALLSMGFWAREQNRLDILLLLAGQLEKVRGRNTAGPARSFPTVGAFEGISPTGCSTRHSQPPTTFKSPVRPMYRVRESLPLPRNMAQTPPLYAVVDRRQVADTSTWT
ncbi:hypothetical protein V8C44DRAFT_315879 [Trichoderma aethiopicum]